MIILFHDFKELNYSQTIQQLLRTLRRMDRVREGWTHIARCGVACQRLEISQGWINRPTFLSRVQAKTGQTRSLDLSRVRRYFHKNSGRQTDKHLVFQKDI